MITPAWDIRAKPEAPHSCGKGTQYASSFLRMMIQQRLRPQVVSPFEPFNRSWLRGTAISTYHPCSSMLVSQIRTAFQSAVRPKLDKAPRPGYYLGNTKY